MADTFMLVGGRLIDGAVPAAGDVLTWDAVLKAWKPAPGGGGGGGALTWFEVMRQRAALLTGIAPIEGGIVMDDFNSIVQWGALFSDGDASCREDLAAGVCRLSLPANGAGEEGIGLFPASRSGPPTPAAGMADYGLPFYVAARCQCNYLSPTGEGSVRLFQTLGGSNAFFGLGSFTRPGGAFSFVSYDGVNPAEEFASTVPFDDANWHLFEFWRTGAGVLQFRVDNEAPISPAVVNVPAGIAAPLIYERSTLGDSARFQIDKFLAFYPLPA